MADNVPHTLFPATAAAQRRIFRNVLEASGLHDSDRRADALSHTVLNYTFGGGKGAAARSASALLDSERQTIADALEKLERRRLRGEALDRVTSLVQRWDGGETQEAADTPPREAVVAVKEAIGQWVAAGEEREQQVVQIGAVLRELHDWLQCGMPNDRDESDVSVLAHLFGDDADGAEVEEDHDEVVATVSAAMATVEHTHDLLSERQALDQHRAEQLSSLFRESQSLARSGAGSIVSSSGGGGAQEAAEAARARAAAAGKMTMLKLQQHKSAADKARAMQQVDAMRIASERSRGDAALTIARCEAEKVALAEEVGTLEASLQQTWAAMPPSNEALEASLAQAIERAAASEVSVAEALNLTLASTLTSSPSPSTPTPTLALALTLIQGERGRGTLETPRVRESRRQE